MKLNRFECLVIPLLAALLTCQACSIRHVAKKYVRSASDALAEGLRRQPDPEIARDSAATLLLSIDAAILRAPDDPELLLSGSQAYTTYCSAFVHEESPQRAFLLYERALEYALEASRIAFDTDRSFADLSDDELNAVLLGLEPKTIPYAYWTATSWAGWLVTHPDTILALADLPRIIGMMEAVLKITPDYNDGGAYLFLGIYESRKPVIAGGDPNKCRLYFEKAMEAAGPDALMPRVLFAQYYSRAVFDRDLFVQTLESVLAAPASTIPELNLSNALARQKATRLLSAVDSLF